MIDVWPHTHVGQKRQPQPGEHAVKSLNRSAKSTSPYTLQDVDILITHLERVLSSEGINPLLPKSHWEGRILRACAMPGLTRTQQDRLQRLLHRVAARKA